MYWNSCVVLNVLLGISLMIIWKLLL